MEESEDFFLSGKDVVIEANLRDEYYWKLVADFIGPQSGEGLALHQEPCKNRVLIQVGLLKEDYNFPWASIVKWLKKIFPMHWTADFRRLIERGITTTLTLLGDSRINFLGLAVNFNFVGPLCDSVGIERRDLLELRDFSERAQLIDVTNGLVLELDDFIQRENLTPIVLVHWLRNFNKEFCKNGEFAKAYSGLKIKLKRLQIYSSNSETKSHRRNVAIESLLQSPFELMSENPKAVVKKLGIKEEPCNYFKVIVKEEPEWNEITPEEAPVTEETVRQMEIIKKEPLHEEINKDQDASNSAEETCDYHKPMTLLDLAVLSVHKLSNLYSGVTEACQEVCLELLKNQYTLLCKEHPSVARFQRTLDLFKKENTEVVSSPVEFIHHNANFIVELHESIEQQIMSFEQEVIKSSRSKLGRDKLPKFHSFVNFTESATSRYIHMACGLLSPRSRDNKNYRKHWMAFCLEKRNPSEIMEYSTSRINNYFEASAGLIHHYKEIGPFFSDLLSLENDKYPNVILESVAADANDPIIQSFVCVLALVYCKILGPYWQLLKSAAAYSLYTKYLLMLYQKFLDWSKDPAVLLEAEQCMNVFLQFPLQDRHYSGVFTYCSYCHTNRELVQACLKRVVKAIKSSADKHLKHFLPGGRYSQVPKANLSRKLSRCTFSVLFSEHHFDQKTSSNKMKPNSDSSGSSDDEDKSNDAEDDDNSDESEVKIETKPSKRLPKKRFPEIMDRDYIIQMVGRNGGPCRTQQDLEKMMLRFERKSRAERYEGVRCEMLYQKMILNNPSQYLSDSTCNSTNMLARLKMSLPRVKPGFSLVLAPRKTPYRRTLQQNNGGCSEAQQ